MAVALAVTPGYLIPLIAQETGDEATAARLAELDAYWAEVSRSVREGDFEGYRVDFIFFFHDVTHLLRFTYYFFADYLMIVLHFYFFREQAS